jgi:hypothetical protein
MRTEISKYSDGHAWRVFKTDFYLLPRTVDPDDYLKFCDIINQSFKNLFNMDYNFSYYVPYDYFRCHKTIFDKDVDHPASKKKKAKIEFELKTADHSIKFSFMFLEVDNFYVFETCDFYVFADVFLDKLPLGIQNQTSAMCSCHFSENQQYQKAYVTYLHTVLNPKNRKNKHTNFLDGDYPHFYYSFCINKNTINLNLEYLYEEYLSSSSYSRHPSKYFSIKLDDVDDLTLLKLRQIASLLSLYSSGFDVSEHYPEINYYGVNEAQKMKWFIYDFLDSPDDETDNILLLEMMKI